MSFTKLSNDSLKLITSFASVKDAINLSNSSKEIKKTTTKEIRSRSDEAHNKRISDILKAFKDNDCAMYLFFRNVTDEDCSKRWVFTTPINEIVSIYIQKDTVSRAEEKKKRYDEIDEEEKTMEFNYGYYIDLKLRKFIKDNVESSDDSDDSDYEF